MSNLTDFLLARIAEDEAGNGCYGEGEYETCFRRSERIDRECEAKRRVVEWVSMEPADDQVLYFLALPYADHPDYREEWKP